MSDAAALSGLLVALLVAPLVLGTHAVVQRAGRRLALMWLSALIALMVLSLGLAAAALFLVVA
jgi:hypothetical protein